MGSEIYWRFGAFFIGLLVFSIWEALVPQRERKIARSVRWTRNLGLNFSSVILVNILNSVLVRFLVPLSAGLVAFWADAHGVGLFNWFGTPEIVAIILSIILLDLIIYAQHVFFHWHPTLWRLHMIHHVDQELDATSGIRFHPVEIVLSLIIKMVAVALLGAPFIAVVIFEIILNLCAMFNHGNIRLPKSIDHWMRKLIVTPDMHRVHHSVIPQETHSNFGFNLSIWDKIFRTYHAEPRDGQLGMSLGLPDAPDVKTTGLLWMLMRPFQSQKNEKDKTSPSSKA